MYKLSILVIALSTVLAGCIDEDSNNENDPGSSNNAGNTPNTKSNTVLSEGAFLLNKSLGSVTFSKNNATSSPLPLNVGFGSGAYHRPGDDNNVFYTLTDRGPNIKCKDAKNVFGIEDFCPPEGDKIFPIPDFTPTIYKIELSKKADESYSYNILEEIPLKDSSGTLITGITNNLTSSNTETSIDTAGNLMNFDNNGLDTEALVRLKDDSFWLTDEYGPSLVHVAKDGKILQRIVPSSIAQDLADANYPVSGLLPDILKMRKLNRGIESIAVSPDEDYLYFAMQSPLANPDKAAYSASRHVRIFKAALDNGNFSSIKGEYVYRLDRAETFVDEQNNGDPGKKQSNVKISEMVAVGLDDLVVLERVSNVTKFYRVNLNTAMNILQADISDMAVENNEDEMAKTLEQVFDLDSHNAHPLSKVLVFNTLTDMPEGISAPSKIEGIAMLDDEYVLLINDNDFGIKGDGTKGIVLKIADKFSGTETASKSIELDLVARHASGQYDVSAAEIVAYHKSSQRIFAVNAKSKKVDVISGLDNMAELNNPIVDTNLSKDYSIEVLTDYADAGSVNSVSIHNNLLAVSVENKNKQQTGVVIFYNLDPSTGEATHVSNVAVCALPDNVVFTPNGETLLAACEGEPSSDYSVDPEGMIASIAINAGVPAATANLIQFDDFNIGGPRNSELPSGVRIFGGAFGNSRSSVAQDLEPEYISVSADSNTAFVSLQENNALAIIDVKNSRVEKIVDLGTKDYSKTTNALDVSDRDKNAQTTGTLLKNGKARINIQAWDNVEGLYQPDSIANYTVDGKTYIVTANEGDAREYLSGEIVSDFTDKAACEAENLNWDISVDACFKGDTPSSCANKGFLNKSNEECFSYVEEFRVEDLTSSGSYSDFIAPVPNEVSSLVDKFSVEITDQINDEALGRLKISIAKGLDVNTGTINTLQSYGARSFAIWNDQGEKVFDSGSDITTITAGRVGEYFNASNDRAPDHKKNDRSSAKGAEPEALTIGQVDGRTYAFVGLERVGGIMVYDITSPYGVQFVEYVTNRDFSKDPTDDIEGAEAGDIGPEGMHFVSKADSPTGKPLLIIGNEVSGSTSVYEIK